MKKLVKGLGTHLGEIMLVCGAAITAAGCAMVYLPAGLIVLGLLCMVGAAFSIWGAEG